ncbi:hypothetical protein [Candidatus Nitrosocosmicus hydrocola]|uniref:hypothetical protein n=1 Tax=Candidatus Nitrosocosmicus hydrocola TaxID=1826872 RepID=UPI0011E5B7D7|nr:hypothetical protein [Candidatus Nitrosocosmicus hydrocola]
MTIVEIKFCGVVLMITGVLLVSVFHSEDATATILSGIDEPTGNAYEDLYIAAEEKNITITSGENQTLNSNNTKTK